MNPTDFKVGDTIEMIESCGGALAKGERLTVQVRNGELFVTGPGTCTCQNKWKLINSLTPTSMSLLNSLRLLTK